MAITYNKIIESTTEPATNNLWLKDGKLYYYKGGWKPLTQEENVSTEDLKLLISEYSDGRQAIATALTNRRYPTEPTESFHAMADKITNMSYEEGWFAKIGYTDENDGGIQDEIDYSYELAKGWNPDGSTAQIFNGNKRIKFAPNIDLSQVVDMRTMYNSCTSLCAVPLIDAKNAIFMNNMFYGCVGLSFVSFSNTNKNTTTSNMFNGCTSLRIIQNLDMSSVANATGIFINCTALVFATMTNIGKSTLKAYNFNGATNWGMNGEENRQSLIDSLITYSYDRASNGMATCTITLSANTKALLTEEEIAQITNKGFTIA